jgi:hypothetical protein
VINSIRALNCGCDIPTVRCRVQKYSEFGSGCVVELACPGTRFVLPKFIRAYTSGSQEKSESLVLRKVPSS